MARGKRRNHSPAFKASVPLAAMKGDRTLAELARQYDIHPNRITDGKTQLLERAAQVFDGPKPEAGPGRAGLERIARQDRAADLGERFFRRGAHRGGTAERKTMIDKTHELSVTRQCEIRELPRSTAYWPPAPESAENLALTCRIDELHPEFRCAGAWMLRDLLRNLTIDPPSQVWAVDIIDIPMRRGFVYRVAAVDWFSRKVLRWRVFNTLTTDFREAIHRYDVPEIFNNTDQRSQFTSTDFTKLLKGHEIRINRDGKGY